MQPLIVDIKRGSLEDGPGIRSVVFFKGCPLRCLFCHSPETQYGGFDIAFNRRLCIRCGACAEVCPNKAVDVESGRIHRKRCNRCEACSDVCPSGALSRIGTYYSPEELCEILLRDVAYYRHSNGGVTLSGGECTLHPGYLEPLLVLLRNHGIHIAIQTSGYFDYRSFREKVLSYCDIVYFDIKLADPLLHKRYTGKSNRKILGNLRALLREKKAEVHPRIPLIPGITADYLNLSAIAQLVREAGASDVTLLPYNPMGFEMASRLGRFKPLLPEKFMTPEEEKSVKEMFEGILARFSQELVV
ncbi:MAG: glycyl-radical enzyme activating protein [Syntrophobacteraceae bacterium]